MFKHIFETRIRKNRYKNQIYGSKPFAKTKWSA